ncbi:hypothetical protein ACH5RR_036241 [Cinchona calisaya]|uniref:Uncharacterized protein n=1 Tax=Cinchona calisaya TaxID=153742 RepID=A0ABD2Y2M9_9GENT
MKFVAKLPNLEVLKLKSYAFQGLEWVPTEAGFCSLKHLLIEKTDLVVWEATSNDFPCFQPLILKFCRMLLEIPISVGAISALQRIELHYCSFLSLQRNLLNSLFPPFFQVGQNP